MVISSYYNYKKYDPTTIVVSVNNASSATLKKKANPKFANISSNGSFTLNGTSNSQSYIGKPNYVISKPPTSSNNSAYCRGLDKNIKTSVKSYSAYLKSKSHCGPVDSLKCYKKLNNSIIDISLNKHINNSSNNDYDMRLFNLKNKVEECFVESSKDCNNYITNKTGCSVNTQNNTSGVRSRYISSNCNIARSNNCINGVVLDYDVYKSKKMFCLYNPSSKRVIAC